MCRNDRWQPRGIVIIALLISGLGVLVEIRAPAENPPAFLWAELVSGGRATLSGLAVDNTHNSYVLGEVVHASLEAGGIAFDSRGTFVAKYDAGGRLLWVTQEAHDRAARGTMIAADARGHVFVTFEVFRPAIVAGKAFGRRGLVLINYDAQGKVYWVAPATLPGALQNAGIAVDPESNCYWAYNLEDTTRGKPTSAAAIEKYDGFGRLLWSRAAFGSLAFAKVAVDGSRGVIIAGAFEERLVLGTTNLARKDMTRRTSGQIYLAKVSAAGDVIWATQGDCLRSISVFNIGVDPAGNCSLVGGFVEKANFGSITLDGGDEVTFRDFVVRYGPEANVLWAQALPGCVTEGRSMVAVDAGANSYLARQCGSGELSFSKLDPAGRMAWTRPGPRIGHFQFATDSSGYNFLAATFSGPSADLDAKTLWNGGDPSRFPGIVLGMLDTTCPPWQGQNRSESKAKGKPVIYIGSAEGFRSNALNASMLTHPPTATTKGLTNFLAPASAQKSR
jgi:hypothetical protein